MYEITYLLLVNMSEKGTTKYDIKGYIPYERNFTNATYCIGTDGTADYGKKVNDSIDVVNTSYFLMIFLVHQMIFNVIFGFINWIPLINIISGLISNLLGGFWMGLIISFGVTLYFAMKHGHQKRTYSDDNIIYRPNITLAFQWGNSNVYVIHSCYTPDIAVCIINNFNNVYEVINSQEVNDCLIYVQDVFKNIFN